MISLALQKENAFFGFIASTTAFIITLTEPRTRRILSEVLGAGWSC